VLSVNLCLIATGKYRALLAGALRSARRYFCADFEPRFHVWSDAPPEIPPLANLVWHPHIHEPWPGPTLHRYHVLYAAAGELLAADYTFYIDADMELVRPVNDEIFSDVVAVVHPGYENWPPSRLPYETRLESVACVHPRGRKKYYIGACQGGRTRRWLAVVEQLRDAIDRDEQAGIVARWHDESHWNHYLALHPPTLELSPDYCCYSDERGDSRQSTRRILHLVKNEAELRT